jgi:hypothetical protein
VVEAPEAGAYSREICALLSPISLPFRAGAKPLQTALGFPAAATGYPQRVEIHCIW